VKEDLKRITAKRTVPGDVVISNAGEKGNPTRQLVDIGIKISVVMLAIVGRDVAGVKHEGGRFSQHLFYEQIVALVKAVLDISVNNKGKRIMYTVEIGWSEGHDGRGGRRVIVHARNKQGPAGYKPNDEPPLACFPHSPPL